jgi:preprotein translocase subunit SecE
LDVLETGNWKLTTGGVSSGMHKAMAMAEHDDKDSISERARESVTGWWGRSRRFLAEVRNETGRVTWPSRKEVYATTVVVILTSVFFGVYLWGVDLLLTSIVGWIYRTLGAA